MFICLECEKPRKKNSDQCPSCGVRTEFLGKIPILLSEKDKEKELFRDYRKIYDSVAAEDLEKSFQHPEYLEIQTDKLFSYLPKETGQSICEVGVGQGLLIKKLNTLSPSQLVGVDIASPYLVKLADEKIPFEPILANAENLPFKEEFDLITSTDVLEHVLNVGNYLHGINQSLKKGGIFVVRTPYLEDYSGYSRYKGCEYDIVHLRNFSKQTLRIILEGAGFKIKKFHYDGYQEHRRRISPETFLGRMITKRLYSKYETYLHLPAIPHWIGRMIMLPCEITAVCEKI